MQSASAITAPTFVFGARWSEPITALRKHQGPHHSGERTWQRLLEYTADALVVEGSTPGTSLLVGSQAVDRLRRVVSLSPVAALPRGCSGDLVLPGILDEGVQDSTPRRLSLATHGDLKLEKAACAWNHAMRSFSSALIASIARTVVERGVT